MNQRKTTKNTPLVDLDKPMFAIGVISEILCIHRRTLRIYDEHNILSPQRTPKNRRLYSMNDIERGKFIQFLTRNIGANIVSVKLILELLRKLNVEPEDYVDFTKDVADNIDITEVVQESNRERLSKRGRKAIAK